MGVGHVPTGALRQARQGDDVPGRQHRGAGAQLADLSDRASVARFGEAVAAWFLEQRGGVVVARNLSVGRGEVDLVVRWGTLHAAVEVKTIGPGASADDPIDRLTPAKLAQVRALAGRLGRTYGRMRVDFVGVRATAEGVSVNWRTNAA